MKFIRILTASDIRRMKVFGSTCFYEEGKGVFLSFCPESTSGTVLILNECANVVRRAFLDCKFDETLLSRQELPSLWKFFTSKVLVETDLDPDDERNPLRVGMASEGETAPKTLKDLLNHSNKEAWLEATRKEDDSLRQMNSYVLIDRKEIKSGDVVHPSRYHWTIKRNGQRKVQVRDNHGTTEQTL